MRAMRVATTMMLTRKKLATHMRRIVDFRETTIKTWIEILTKDHREEEDHPLSILSQGPDRTKANVRPLSSTTRICPA